MEHDYFWRMQVCELEGAGPIWRINDYVESESGMVEQMGLMQLRCVLLCIKGH